MLEHAISCRGLGLPERRGIPVVERREKMRGCVLVTKAIEKNSHSGRM